MIKVTNLCKVYENATPLNNFSAVINDGDVISVIGPSGAGKSTFIRCLNLLESPTSGKIYVDDICVTDKNCDIKKVRRKMGMVFQSFNLFSHMTVLENVICGPIDLLKMSKTEAIEKGMALLSLVGLAGKAYDFPDDLSGGQKQRVAIARTLAMEPEIILFDEPTSALDPTMVGEVQSVIRELAKRGLTMIIVTHDMAFAREVSNRIFYLDQGELYEEGTPEQIFEYPSRNRTREFIQRMKVLYERLDYEQDDTRALLTEIDSFGRNHYLDAKLISYIQKVTETLCLGSIMKELSQYSHIHYLLECSDIDSSVNIHILWKGLYINPISKLNEEEINSLDLESIKVEFKCGENNNSFSLIGLDVKK